MIENIIFDIGNVLADFCWREHIALCGYAGETAERLGRAMMQSPVWNEIDRGVWSEEELLEGFIRNDPELKKEIRHVFADMSTIVRKKPGSEAWLQGLKEEGYRLYYLSNFSGKIKRECEEQLSFLRWMDGGIMSYEICQIKPDEEIYRSLLAKYGLRPEECVFLDDLPANLKTAKRLGIRGILVEDQEQAAKELASLLAERGRR